MTKAISIPLLVVGESFSCYHLAHTLKENPLLWLQRRGVNRSDFQLGFTELLRGEGTFQLLKQIFPQLEITLEASSSSFWKDQAFHSFQGKIKPPNELLSEESFFTPPRIHFPWSELTPMDDEKKSLVIKEGGVKRVEREGACWKVTLMDEQIILANQLVWGWPLSLFWELLAKEEKESWPEIPYPSQAKKVLVVSFSAEKNLTARDENLFLSQCLSQERGYFIGRFYPFSSSEEKQSFSFFCFLDSEEEDPEAVARKIRHLKRTLKRSFPQLRGDGHDKIILNETLYPLLINDENYQKLWSVQNLPFFVGPSAPLSPQFCENYQTSWNITKTVDPMTRDLISCEWILNSLRKV